jgi:hypothetical protein
MSPTGPLYAGTATSGSGASGAWTTPSNATGVDDASYASGNISTGGSQTNNLLLTNFGFNIPATAIIDGVVVEFKRYGTNAQTMSIQLLKAGVLAGTGHGINDYSDIWPPTTAAYVTYGSSNSLWGTTWTPTDINNTNFGVAISALNTHGGGTAFVDAVRITVYWHTAPTAIPLQSNYIYKVFDSISGAYLGNLPNVSTDFSLPLEINSSGAQITIKCAVTPDISDQPVEAILDETGAAVLDESNNAITTDTATPYSSPGIGGALIRNGNTIQIWEYNYYYPNGHCRFLGRIDKHEDNLKTDSGDDLIIIYAYSDGMDLDQYMVLNQPTVDQSQTAADSTAVLYFGNTYPAIGQSVTPGTGISGVARIRLKLSAVAGNTPIVSMGLYASRAGIANFSAFQGGIAPDAVATQIVTSTNAKTYDFIFNYKFPTTFSGSYTFVVYCTDTSGVNIYYQSTDVYANGSLLSQYITGGDLYFQTYGNSQSTNPTYASIDPSNIALSVISNYGGDITASGTTVQPSNLTVNYQFNTATVHTGLQNVLTLAPSGFYYYVDPGTDIFYLQPASTTADYTLVKGIHLNDVSITPTTEYLVNTVYVVGGTPVSASQIYTLDQDAASVARYGQRAQIHTDQNILDAVTAHIVAQNIIEANKDEQYMGEITVLGGTMDISLLLPGKTLGFSGFGSYIDGVVVQIVRAEFSPDKVVLQLGILPKRASVQIEQTIRDLISLATVDNSATPS